MSYTVFGQDYESIIKIYKKYKNDLYPSYSVFLKNFKKVYPNINDLILNNGHLKGGNLIFYKGFSYSSIYELSRIIFPTYKNNIINYIMRRRNLCLESAIEYIKNKNSFCKKTDFKFRIKNIKSELTQHKYKFLYGDISK